MLAAPDTRGHRIASAAGTALAVLLLGALSASAQVCGDGVPTPPETCDDGNVLPGDGCSPLCQRENLPPLCDRAFADVQDLWPPNHRLVPVSIAGVTDPDGDPLLLAITAVAQDEPVDDTGDGATCPDAIGLGGDVVRLRAERQGSGDGRVYHVAFVATDPLGAACTGAVSVCVRHDRRPGGTCGDGGPLYDSAAGAPGACGDSDTCDPRRCIPTAAELLALCEPLPRRVQRKLTRARILLERATTAARPRRQARLTRRADRLLLRADAQVTRILSGSCLAAIGAALDAARTCVACALPVPR
ncbi:MAG: hypothetical protein KIT14_17250 [bacterium]|nr:hypothetical protein [bacterium]